MAFKKGDARPPGSGRAKGTPNKSTQTVKQALEIAYRGIGGDDNLIKWAARNNTEFYKIWSKMMPTQVDVKDVSKMDLDELKQEAIKLLSEME